MTALYQQVVDQILEQIQTGRLTVGERLPPEAEFASHLGVSRSTLRLAFTELENAGVVSRRKRTGTLITSDTPKQRFSMATGGLHELLSLGRDTVLEVMSTREIQTGDLRTLTKFSDESNSWLEITGSRTIQNDSTPFSINRVYLPERFMAIKKYLKTDANSVYSVIETNFNVKVARVTQTVRAIACPPSDAKIIGLNKDAPALQIDASIYLDDGTLMEVSNATFDPNRFQVHTDVEVAGLSG